ncbi:MAG: three-Cys-motif partner protein TcmP [Anaerolineaceae bacterium]|nr:three-Cys-motif partner protein TcmP [Anaerolineaceae bacterium]
MSTVRYRPIQTRVKHEILAEYLAKWGEIIITGLKDHAKSYIEAGYPFKARFAYVDCFANSGMNAPDIGGNEPTLGSAILGIQALDEIKNKSQRIIGFELPVISFLIERDKQVYGELLETLLSLGYGSRIREGLELSALSPDDIVLINDDYQNHLDSLLTFTGKNFTWAFYLLDPYGSQGIPLSAVERVISQPKTDVMINYPFLELQRKSRSAVDNVPAHIPHNHHHDQMYGGREWRQIAAKYYRDLTKEWRPMMEGELIELYQLTLQELDPELALKTIRLLFTDKDRTMFYLLLTTHDPTGALALNEILDNAESREYELREEHKNVVKKQGQLSLFESGMDDPAKPTAKNPDHTHIANLIYERCKEERIWFREVLRRMSDDPYYYGDIREAMKKLKKDKRVSYKILRNSMDMSFS